MQDKLISEEEAVAFAQIYEYLAGMKREVARVLDLAKMPGSTVSDITHASSKLLSLVEDYELALAISEEGEYDEE